MSSLLKLKIDISEEELLSQFQDFQNCYPEGKISEEEFMEIFSNNTAFSPLSLFRQNIFIVLHYFLFFITNKQKCLCKVYQLHTRTSQVLIVECLMKMEAVHWTFQNSLSHSTVQISANQRINSGEKIHSNIKLFGSCCAIFIRNDIYNLKATNFNYLLQMSAF